MQKRIFGASRENPRLGCKIQIGIWRKLKTIQSKSLSEQLVIYGTNQVDQIKSVFYIQNGIFPKIQNTVIVKDFLGNSSLTRFLYCNFSYNSIYPHIKFFFSRLSGFQLVNKYVSETTCGPVHFHIGLNIKLGRTTNQIKSKFSSETMCS